MQAQNKYMPGACNIGRSEIRRRELLGWIGLLATVIVYSLLVFFDIPRIWRLVIFIPATLAALGFLQARMHFCAYLGMRGVFNFESVGNLETVAEAELRAKDRRKALRIIAYSVITGILAVLVSVMVL